MNKLNLLNGICLVLAMSVSAPAYTQDKRDSNNDSGNRALSIGIGFTDNAAPVKSSVGLALGPAPEFEGSDNYAVMAAPLFNISKQGHYFLKGASVNINDGLASAGLSLMHFSYYEQSSRRLQVLIGPLLRAYPGRDESDSDALNGLDDIDQSVGLGGFLQIHSGAWLGQLSVSPLDAGHSRDGLLAQLDIEYKTQIHKGFDLSTGLTTSWADDDTMQGYFGVTDSQSMQSGLSSFDAGAGFKDIGLQLKAAHSLSPSWSLDWQIGYWRLLNDAADSPIVKAKGSADQLRGLLGLSYQF